MRRDKRHCDICVGSVTLNIINHSKFNYNTSLVAVMDSMDKNLCELLQHSLAGFLLVAFHFLTEA